MSLFGLSLSLALTLTGSAHATIYGGNPELTIRVDRPAHDLDLAEVTLGDVRVNWCGGGYTEYAVDALVDLVQGATVTIGGGDICGFRFFWKDAMVIESPTFVLEYAKSYTDVLVTTTPQPASLTPFTVVQGNISGSGPELFVAID